MGTQRIEKELQMPKNVQTKMEQGMGYDFSKVELKESKYAEEIGANAYAQGTTIHFAPGKFNPLTIEGQGLIGHELGHVVQQSKGDVKAESAIQGESVNFSSSLENEADRFGEMALKGEINQQAYGSELEVAEVGTEGVIQGDWKDTANTGAKGVGYVAGGVSSIASLVAAFSDDKEVQGIAEKVGAVAGATDFLAGLVADGTEKDSSTPATTPAVSTTPTVATTPVVATTPAVVPTAPTTGNRSRRRVAVNGTTTTTSNP